MTSGSGSVASRIVQARKSKRLSRAALARALHVSATSVWNWETGQVEPRHENLFALGKVLGTSAEFLATGEGSPEVDVVDEVVEPKPRQTTLVEVITEAKRMVAQTAGLRPDQIRIQLDY